MSPSLNPTQLAMLTHLRRGGKNGRQIAAVLGISKSAVYRNIALIGPLAPRLPLAQIAKAIAPYGFVYVFGAQNLVKIGITRNSIYRRWWSIKVGNPWLERPLYVSPPLRGRVIRVERACHKALKQYRVVGEWFECDRQLAIETVRRMIEETT